MADYQLTDTGVLHKPTGFRIPEDVRNRHWNAYLLWVKEGNVPDAADAPPAPPALDTRVDRAFAADPVLGGLLDAIAELLNTTPDIVLARVKAKATARGGRA